MDQLMNRQGNEIVGEKKQLQQSYLTTARSN